jgi:glucose-1-phosphate thymidylyltransferase
MDPSMTDKAVILARGLGTRMRRADGAAELDASQAAAADSGVKALIPVGRPFLDYVLSGLADAGYRRVCLVVGPEHGALRDYYGYQVRPQRVSVEYAVQVEPRGTADAVAAAETFAGEDPFLVINSDNYYPIDALRALRSQPGSATALFDWEGLREGNIPEDRLRRFSVGLLDEQGKLRRILEKPDEATLAALPRPLLVSMNCWRFCPSIFRACRAIKPSPRGEFEIPDAVQYVIDVLGEPFYTVPIRAPVLDLTSRADIASVKAALADVAVEL